jgi:hypothetical protein
MGHAYGGGGEQQERASGSRALAHMPETPFPGFDFSKHIAYNGLPR